MQPGIHIIAELSVSQDELLNQFEPLRELLRQLIAQHDLSNLGEVYHNFSPRGFTALVCLSESHISFHSFPEFHRLHLDIYLSNYSRNNHPAGQAIFESVVQFYNAAIIGQQTLYR